MKNILTKVSTLAYTATSNAKESLKKSAPVLSAAAICLSMGTALMFDASSVVGMVMTLLGTVLLAFGLFRGIMGVVHYAGADDDGPAKSKATGQIAGGVAIIVLGIALIALKGTIGNLINNIAQNATA